MQPEKDRLSPEAKEAFLVAQKLGSRYIEGEDIISKDPYYSVEYSKIIGRFEKGESAIATSPKFSTFYAVKILKGRFVLGETSIAESPYYSCAYSVYVLKGSKNDVIHRSMLKRGIVEKDNYWVKEYCRYMEYLEGRGPKPYWADENAAINWL